MSCKPKIKYVVCESEDDDIDFETWFICYQIVNSGWFKKMVEANNKRKGK